MAQINSYLTFNGNCREAMTFYKECLGGELLFQTIGGSPMADKMPAHMNEYILHATLTNGNLVIMGSDMAPQNGLVNGNAITMMLDCNSEAEIKKFYESLSKGGNPEHPLEETFWGAIFGGLTDKYENPWLLNFTQNKNN